MTEVAKNGMPLPLPIKVVLGDGNAFAILGACTQALKRSKEVPEEAKETLKAEFLAEAQSGNYEHLLMTVGRWFEATTIDMDEDDEFGDEEDEDS